eukprot:scaffold12248_cov110-Isochrysis_galbana.AAC.2
MGVRPGVASCEISTSAGTGERGTSRRAAVKEPRRIRHASRNAATTMSPPAASTGSRGLAMAGVIRRRRKKTNEESAL